MKQTAVSQYVVTVVFLFGARLGDRRTNINNNSLTYPEYYFSPKDKNGISEIY